MATTPEDFFIKDLMAQPPASPPVFLDLLQNQKPSVVSNNEVWRHVVPDNDMVLPYISHMLMEDDDDVDDELISDDPTLLQVQQPFAQILSSPSSLGTNTTSNMEGCRRQRPNGSLQQAGLGHGDDEQSALSSAYKGGAKGRPTMTFKEEEPEEKRGSEMFDEMMSRAYETCIKSMERVAVDNSGGGGGGAHDKRNRRSGRSARGSNVVDIGALLTSCVKALADGDHVAARNVLAQVKQHASATGDAAQRMAHCFARGIEARIAGTGSWIWRLRMSVSAHHPSSVVDFLKAYSLYTRACCFLNVTFIFSAMTIVQAMAGNKSSLHIVDYGTRYGFQWAGLLRLLSTSSTKQAGLPVVKFTAITDPRPAHYPGEQVERIGRRLTKCARELGFPSFKFHAITRKWEDVSAVDLHRNDDDDDDDREVLVVSDLFSFSVLMEESVFFDSPSPRDTVLGNVRRMRPDVFIQSVTNRSYGSSFLSRFREMLFYYMAVFDMLDATVPRESRSRLVLEQVLLGHYVFNDISCEGMDLVQRPEKYRQWQARNRRAGLRQLPLKPSIVKAVEDEVTKHYHMDFMVCQDGQWLLQGWMGRALTAHTAWVADI